MNEGQKTYPPLSFFLKWNPDFQDAIFELVGKSPEEFRRMSGTPAKVTPAFYHRAIDDSDRIEFGKEAVPAYSVDWMPEGHIALVSADEIIVVPFYLGWAGENLSQA